jgi:hypothetical protein
VTDGITEHGQVGDEQHPKIPYRNERRAPMTSSGPARAAESVKAPRKLCAVMVARSIWRNCTSNEKVAASQSGVVVAVPSSCES